MSEPIRVLMLFTIMNRGGAETMVMNYYRHIDRSKVQFDFMVHRQERGAFDDEIERLGGQIFRMESLSIKHLNKYKKHISSFFNTHPEYRIIHGHCSELGYFVYKEAAKRNIPVIIAHAHNSHVAFDFKLLFRNWLKHRMRHYLTNFFACGTESAEWLFGKKLAKQAIIQHNAIDVTEWKFDNNKRKTFRNQLNISDDTIVIGHVGRFYRQKNHTFLIDIFNEVHKHTPNSVLLLVGGGDLQQKTKEKVERLGLSKYVRFMGNRSDVYNWVNAMDVFVFPSLWEGFPASLVEMQANGLYCLVSSIVPHEVAITEQVHFVPLAQGAEAWATDTALHMKRMGGCEESYLQVKKAGYDIKENACWLQNFYLSVYK